MACAVQLSLCLCWMLRCCPVGSAPLCAAQPDLQLPHPAPPACRIFLVDVPGAQQAAVATGEPGIQLMDRDEYSLQVGGQLHYCMGGRLPPPSALVLLAAV